MNVLPHTPGDKAGTLDMRLVVVGVLFLGGAGYWQYQRHDRIGQAEATMIRLEQRIKQESMARMADREMLGRLYGDRRKRLEGVIAEETRRIDAWQAEWHELELSIREWKAESRGLEGKQP